MLPRLARTPSHRQYRVMTDTPHFESAFLENLSTAFRNRRRALSQRACRVEIAKTYEIEHKNERLEIEIGGVVGKGPVLQFHAWPDGRVWVEARHPTKDGWAWSWTNDGRLNGREPKDVVEVLETTFELVGEVTPGRGGTLNDLWKPLLVEMPKSAK